MLERLKDYFELTKPRINFLVLVTTTVGYSLAEPKVFISAHLLWTLMGTGLTVGCANALNHCWERRTDALMKRTRNRPLPAGRIKPWEAFWFGIITGTVGIFILTYWVNILSAGLALTAILSYVPLYTALKPVTSLSTLVGTIPGAIPPVMGWTAVTGSIDFSAVVLFLIMFFWQPPHFLALALYLKEDYRRANLSMLPVEMNEDVSMKMMVLYTFFLMVVSFVPVLTGLSGPVYFYTAFVLGLLYFFISVYSWIGEKGTEESWARGLFLFSVIHLPILLGVLVWDRIVL